MNRVLTALRRVHPLQWLARLGYAARGIVYAMAGALSLMAAVELREETAGVLDVLAAFGEWPLGPVWLFILGLGLCGFAAWRWIQAVLDPDREGTSWTALVRRAGWAISGSIYGALGYSALDLSDSLGVLRPKHPGHALLQQVMSTAFADEILFGLSACIAVAAVGNAAKALSNRLARELSGGREIKRWVVPLGRLGYMARALVFGLFGVLTLRSALGALPDGLTSLSHVLRVLESQPFGTLLLGASALGFMAFGAFGLVEALHHRIHVPPELS